jgi:tRNA (guanine37-N1)-methyltransferase
MLKIDILTLFPDMFKGPFEESIVKRAEVKKLVEINVHNLRKWATDERKTVDDRPYGGGAGMIIRVDIVDRAVRELQSAASSKQSTVILLDARGKKFNQKNAHELSKSDHLILIAGHYEGVDHRIADNIADEVISIGEYVLTGGELPAMVMTDAITRLIPGVIDPESLKEESFSVNSNQSSVISKPEYPQYTRPEDYKGWKVPEVLLSGNHKEISEWRKEKSEEK